MNLNFLSVFVFAMALCMLGLPAQERVHRVRDVYPIMFQDDVLAPQAAATWVSAHHETNATVASLLAAASVRFERPDLRLELFAKRHTEKDVKLLHEYTSPGLEQLIAGADVTLKLDLIAQLRAIDKIEERLTAIARSDKRTDVRAIELAADSYASLLSDLDAKIRAVKFRANAATIECNVTVHTIDTAESDPAKREVKNHEVVYVQEFWKDNQVMWQTYDKFSSPTKQSITAGYYLFWCRTIKADGTPLDGERKRVVVSDDKDIEVPVPKKLPE